MKKRYAILVAALISEMSTASIASDSQLFELGAITVGAQKTQQIESNRVDSDEMQSHGDTQVGQAVSRVPGVVIREGGRRAESQASIRGFDSRQISLNLDGIPIYLPYDGNMDLSRYLTSDLSRIEVQKTMGSLLLGPNNMGGSINLVSRKPTQPFEGSATVGLESGESGIFSKFGNVQIGGRVNERFYFMAGVSKVRNDDFPLSNDFTPSTNQFTQTVVQPKGDRLRSANESETLNFKVGFTPNKTDEYVVGYHQITGQKEAPLYADGDLSGNAARPAYWDWPQWDKRSLYFLSHTQFDKTYLKTRAYYDQFDNALNSYDDETYSSVTKGYAFRSQYDDQGVGASAELGHQLENQLLKMALHVKYDEHKERDLNKDNLDVDQSWRTYQNEIYSFGLEDAIQISEATKLTLGYRRDQYRVTKTDDGDPNTQPSKDQIANNFQIKAEHQIGSQTLFGGLSKKTRFPSIKETYSYRLGQAIPNADLDAESALHYELGSLGTIGQIDYQANLFYSDITDAIESVSIEPSLCSEDASSCSQNQNIGTATHYGAEFMVKVPMTEDTRLDLNYAYLKRDLADSTLKPTQSPEHQGLITLNWFATPAMDLALDWEIKTKRETTTDGLRPTDGYQLWHLRGAYQINKQVSANAVLKNALDTDYQIYDGDPMPGRTLLMSLNAKF